MLATFLILIIIGLILWCLYLNFVWKCTVKGIMYFAEIDHNWKICMDELKNMAKYAAERSINDIFNKENKEKKRTW